MAVPPAKTSARDVGVAVSVHSWDENDRLTSWVSTGLSELLCLDRNEGCRAEGGMSVDTDENAGLRSRLWRTLLGRSLEEVLPGPRALAGVEAAAEACDDVAFARRAAKKLQQGGRLLPLEIEALELGLRRVRPAARVERGRLPLPLSHLLTKQERARIEAFLPGIGAVCRGAEFPLATAFQVAPRLMMTNAHVAHRLLEQRECLVQGDFVIQFDGDAHRPARVIPIMDVLAVHPTEDVACLELAGPGPLEKGLCLAREPGCGRESQVLVVGYPVYCAGVPLFLEALFENVFGVKRASPGECLGVEDGSLYHDCTTLAGSSGSPVLDPWTGMVVGIHACGQFARRNRAVSTRVVHSEQQLRALVASWS